MILILYIMRIIVFHATESVIDAIFQYLDQELYEMQENLGFPRNNNIQYDNGCEIACHPPTNVFLPL